MTMPDERTRAVIWTRGFLRELTDPTVTPGVPAAVRCRAETLLRHYPAPMDMRLVHLACPQWFGPPNAWDDPGEDDE